MYLLGSKNTSAFIHANSVSSMLISFIAKTNSSIMRAPILDMSKFGDSGESTETKYMNQFEENTLFH